MDTLRYDGDPGQPDRHGIHPTPPEDNGRPTAPGDDRGPRPVVGAATGFDEALRLRNEGLWPVAIYPRGVTRRDGAVTEGKEPIGPQWGLHRWDTAKLEDMFRRYPGAGVGVGLGPGRGPEGRWLTDIEGDGPDAEESRAKLFGGAVIASKGWCSTRGEHLLLTLDEQRILEILPGLKSFETGKPGQPGVYKFADLPGLELRIGGYTETKDATVATVKQLQGVVPPTPGTDDRPRTWTGGPDVAPAPDSFYRTLAALAARRPAQGSAPTSPGSDQTGRGRAAIAETPQAAWFRKVLEGEAGKVALTAPGSRHAALLAAATTLGGHLHHGYFSEPEVVAALMQAAGSIPGDRVKDAATIQDGLAYGRARPLPWPARLERLSAAPPRPTPSTNGADRRAGDEGAMAAVAARAQSGYRPDCCIFMP
jgi:hypothetical protein